MRILSRTPRSHSWLKAPKLSHQERAQFFVSCRWNCASQSFFRSSVEFIQYLQLVIFIFSLEQPTHRLITSCACPPASLCVVFSNYLMIWHGYTSIGTICQLSLWIVFLHLQGVPKKCTFKIYLAHLFLFCSSKFKLSFCLLPLAPEHIFHLHIFIQLHLSFKF